MSTQWLVRITVLESTKTRPRGLGRFGSPADGKASEEASPAVGRTAARRNGQILWSVISWQERMAKRRLGAFGAEHQNENGWLSVAERVDPPRCGLTGQSILGPSGKHAALCALVVFHSMV